MIMSLLVEYIVITSLAGNSNTFSYEKPENIRKVCDVRHNGNDVRSAAQADFLLSPVCSSLSEMVVSAAVFLK